jgi:hypothetical protein
MKPSTPSISAHPVRRKGKSGSQKKEKEGKKKIETARMNEEASGFFAVLLMLAIMLAIGYFGDNLFYDPVEGRMAFIPRASYFMLLHPIAAQVMAIVMLQVARWLDGEVGESWLPSQTEMESNDPSIKWPHPYAPELVDKAKKGGNSRKQQPFFLNHQTGAQRRKDMFMRIGMMLGTVITVTFMSATVDKTELKGINLDATFMANIANGVCVGGFIVFSMFAVELAAGWIRFHCFCEVFDHEKESNLFFVNIFQEVIFHLSVSINEEVPMRGW